MSIIIPDNEELIFLPGIDQKGNDYVLSEYEKKNIKKVDDLVKFLNKNDEVVGINTQGFTKNKITNFFKPEIYTEKDGLYIKKNKVDSILSYMNKSSDYLHIDNIKEVDDFIEKIKFNGPEGYTVMFTNGNYWYINTLIKNLIYSYDKFNKKKDRKIGVFCSDIEGYNESNRLGFETCMVNCEKMKIKNSIKDVTPEEYRRLTFTKILLINYIISKNYTVLYIDPDMSFNYKKYNKIDFVNEILNRKKSINYTFDISNSIAKVNNYENKIDNVVAGYIHKNMFENKTYNLKFPITTIYLNSNLLLVSPTFFNKVLYKVSINEFEYVCKNVESGSDETYINRVGRNGNYFSFWDERYFPNGSNSEKYKDHAYLFHSNCVSGLKNKINLLRKCGGWYLDTVYEVNKDFIPVRKTLEEWQRMKKQKNDLIVQASVVDGSDEPTFCSIGMSYEYLNSDLNDVDRKDESDNRDNLLLFAIKHDTDKNRRGKQNVNRQNIIKTLNKNGFSNTKLNSTDYFNKLPTYKFVISPEGNGIDCHRHYEALLSGCIPIVEKSDLILEKYGDCPILYTTDYSEITTEYLEKKYEEMKSKVYDFSKLFLSYYSTEYQNIIKERGDFWCNKLVGKTWYK